MTGVQTCALPICPLKLLARQEVFAQAVKHGVQLLSVKAELLVNCQAIEQFEFSLADVPVCQDSQRDDTGGGLRAVAQIGSQVICSLSG